MSFRICGLPIEPFAPLFGLVDEALARAGARRYVADSKPGFPCRITLADAEIGERVLLLNYEHQPAESPFRSSHAIFVREGAGSVTVTSTNEVPPALRTRILSLRAFDADGMMLDAELVAGGRAEPAIERLFANPYVAYLHAHYATRGCYAARIDRIEA